MSSTTLLMPLSGGRARVRLTEANGQWGMSLVDPAGNVAGKSVRLNSQDVKALATVAPQWKDSLIWALLGYGTKDRRPLASTYAHPGTGRMA